MLQLAVVGAGPHALALIARLLDDRPNTECAFEAGAPPKPTGMRKGMRELFQTPRCRRAAARLLLQKTAIVDPSGRWMTQWDKAFSALQIHQLRSTFEMHPCIFDAFAMQAFAKKKGMQDHFGVFAASRGKANNKTMFGAPSADLFLEFCAHLVDLYGLRDAVTADRVTKLTRRADGVVRLSLLSGRSLLARHVVVATGPTTVPRIPAWADGLWRPTAARAAGVPAPAAVAAPEKGDEAAAGKCVAVGAAAVEAHAAAVLSTEAHAAADAGVGVERTGAASTQGGGIGEPAAALDAAEPADRAAPPEGAIAHAWQLIDHSHAGGVPTRGATIPHIRAKTSAKWSQRLDGTPRLLIVGGGLTAVHLFRRAVHVHGCRHVHLVSREEEFLVKQFDINLDWVSYSSRVGKMATFTREPDPSKRLKLLRAARGRGSITPEARAALDATLADAAERAGGADKSDVCVKMGAAVVAASWISADDGCTTPGEWEVYMADGSVQAYDIIWLATGSVFDVQKDPLLGDLFTQRPVDHVGGLPVIEPTLRWCPGCEVYVMGAFAALSLGPDALNLTGARTGACRICSVLRPAMEAAVGAPDPSTCCCCSAKAAAAAKAAVSVSRGSSRASACARPKRN